MGEAATKHKYAPEIVEAVQKLRLIDDNFMRWAFADHPECVELMLQIIMDKPTLKVKHMKTEAEIKNLQGKSVIFDVRADDGEKEYDIEVQRDDRGASPRRARYHSSLMDANALSEGSDVAELLEHYVVFITEHDVLGLGLPIYHIERMVTEAQGKLFGDGAHIVYVNGEIRDGTPLGRLMQDFFATKFEEMHYGVLKQRVSEIKHDEKGVGKMCKIIEDLTTAAEARGIAKGEALGEARGIAKGEVLGIAKGEALVIAKGEAESKINLAKRMIAIGKLSYEEISVYTDLGTDVIMELADKKIA